MPGALGNIRIAADITCKNFQRRVSRAGFIRICRGLKDRAGKGRDVGAACVKSVVLTHPTLHLWAEI